MEINKIQKQNRSQMPFSHVKLQTDLSKLYEKKHDIRALRIKKQIFKLNCHKYNLKRITDFENASSGEKVLLKDFFQKIGRKNVRNYNLTIDMYEKNYGGDEPEIITEIKGVMPTDEGLKTATLAKINRTHLDKGGYCIAFFPKRKENAQMTSQNERFAALPTKERLCEIIRSAIYKNLYIMCSDISKSASEKF